MVDRTDTTGVITITVNDPIEGIMTLTQDFDAEAGLSAPEMANFVRSFARAYGYHENTVDNYFHDYTADEDIYD